MVGYRELGPKDAIPGVPGCEVELSDSTKEPGLVITPAGGDAAGAGAEEVATGAGAAAAA